MRNLCKTAEITAFIGEDYTTDDWRKNKNSPRCKIRIRAFVGATCHEILENEVRS